ncbi:type II secretion system pilot lipoprotein GspS, partial [Yersinia pseudotuberculosis]
LEIIMPNSNIKLMVFFAPILFGCQINSEEKKPNEEIINQLTALTAGLRFLKEDCNLKKIPNEQEIINSAIKIANLKGEIMTSKHNNKIIKKSESLYQDIKSDLTAKNTKCLELEELLTPFIKKIN